MDNFVWAADLRSFKLRLWRTKTSRRGGYWVEIEVVALDTDVVCAVSLLRTWFTRLNLWNKRKETVFPAMRHSRSIKGHSTIDRLHQYSRSRWISMLRSLLTQIGLDASLYSGHGFRAGGATDLFDAGMSLVSVMSFGRWRTAQACLQYYRKGNHLPSEVAKAFASLDQLVGRSVLQKVKRGQR